MIALKLFQVNILNHISKNYYMFFMTWFSKTWTQMNIQFLNLTLFCSRLGMPSFIFPSLDNDRTIQDLVFQVLKPFGVINFSIRPKEELWFSCLGLPRHDHKKMIVSQHLANEFLIFLFKTWHAKFWNVTSFCKSMFPSIDKLRLGTPSLELFGVNTFNSTSKKKKNHVLVFQDMNTSIHKWK